MDLAEKIGGVSFIISMYTDGMPLSNKAYNALAKLADVSGDFTLFGIYLNPVTGEMGTYSSQPFSPGQVLGFLQRSTEEMLEAAKRGELQGVNDGEAGKTKEGSNGIQLIH